MITPGRLFHDRQLLTLEARFCILCWRENKRVQLAGSKLLRPGESTATIKGAALARYNRLRRKAVLAHIAEAHPDYVGHVR